MRSIVMTHWRYLLAGIFAAAVVSDCVALGPLQSMADRVFLQSIASGLAVLLAYLPSKFILRIVSRVREANLRRWYLVFALLAALQLVFAASPSAEGVARSAQLFACLSGAWAAAHLWETRAV